MDKLKHLIVSCAEVIVLSLFVNLMLAVLITIGLGIIKEIYDSYQPNNKFDWWDMVANLVGIGFGVLICM